MHACLDAHDGAHPPVTIVKGLELGKRVGTANVGMEDKDLFGRAFEDGVTEMVETACSSE